MQLVTTTLPVKTGSEGEVTAVWQQQIARLREDYSGLMASVLGSDRDAGTMVVNVIWDSPESVQAIEENGRFREIIGLISPYLAGQPSRQRFEIMGMAPAH